MGYIVLATILAIALIAAIVVAIVGPGDREVEDPIYRGRTKKVPGLRKPARLTAVALAVALALLTGISAFTTVGARAVGIQTSLGQYRDTLESGAQLTAPWSSVEEFSTQIQTLDLSDLDGSKGNAVSVAFSGNDKAQSGGNGVVNAVVRWQIDPASAEKLWKKYTTFERVQSELVLSESQDAFRRIIGGYEPNAARAGANIRPIAEAVKTGLGEQLKDDGILIDSVSIKRVDLDAATAKSLERTVIANNDIATAKAQQERAKIDNETARLRAESGALKPEAMARYCLDVVNAWDVSKNGPLPATFNCGLGSSAGTSILVGAK